MKYERGTWRVERDCCTGGLCVDCHGGPDRLKLSGKRPSRVVQGSGYSEAYAKFVASNWSSYKAEALPSLLKVRIDVARRADRKRIAALTKDATAILVSLNATLRTFRECIGAEAFAEFRKDNKTIIEAVRLVTLHGDPVS